MVIDVSIFPGDRYYLLGNYGTWPLGGDPEFESKHRNASKVGNEHVLLKFLHAKHGWLPVAADMPGAIGMEWNFNEMHSDYCSCIHSWGILEAFYTFRIVSVFYFYKTDLYQVAACHIRNWGEIEPNVTATESAQGHWNAATQWQLTPTGGRCSRMLAHQGWQMEGLSQCQCASPSPRGMRSLSS